MQNSREDGEVGTNVRNWKFSSSRRINYPMMPLYFLFLFPFLAHSLWYFPVLPCKSQELLAVLILVPLPKRGFPLPKAGRYCDFDWFFLSRYYLFLRYVVLVIDLVSIKYDVLFYSRFESSSGFFDICASICASNWPSSDSRLCRSESGRTGEIFLAIAGTRYSSHALNPSRPCTSSGREKTPCKHRTEKSRRVAI